jgi:molybdate transport system substrate-binding protein
LYIVENTLIPRRETLAFLLSLGIAGCGRDVERTEVRSTVVELKIAAAADLQFALEEVAAAFDENHPDIKLAVTTGSSGQLFTQLSNGAPFDIFLSADIQLPRKLVEQELAIADSEFLYAHGHLVVWVHKDSPLELADGKLDVLLDPRVKKIAIANPKFAPYGRAAEAALKKLELYDQVKDRLVLGENVSQAAMFVQSGAADVGIVGLSQALAPAVKEKGRFAMVPADAYPTLEQGGVIMKRCRHPDAARRFCDFLRSDQGAVILGRYGFDLPKD